MAKPQVNRPLVGVGVLVQKNGSYLLGKRITPHGKDSWSVVGGHLEFGESFEECAARETYEESAIKIKNIRFLTSVNNVFKDENHHSVTIFMAADWASGEPETTEPDKIINVGWYDLANHPEPLFLPMIELKNALPGLFR